MLVIGGGFSQNDDHLWARGIEIEVCAAFLAVKLA